MRPVQIAAFFALGTIALSGCTPSTPSAIETPAAPAASPTPEAILTPSPTPATGDVSGVPGCSTLAKIDMPNIVEGQKSYQVAWNGVEPVDNGVSDYAQGVVTKTDDGRIASYTVAEGDTPTAVGERLCISIYTYTWYNRMGGSLYPGDVIVLGPGTMTPNEYVTFESEPQRR